MKQPDREKEYFLIRNNQCAASDGVIALANIMKELPKGENEMFDKQQ